MEHSAGRSRCLAAWMLELSRRSTRTARYESGFRRRPRPRRIASPSRRRKQWSRERGTAGRLAFPGNAGDTDKERDDGLAPEHP